MVRSRTMILSLGLALTASLLVPVAALAALTSSAAAGDPVVTDSFQRSKRSWTVGNTVDGGVSTPSVRQCYRVAPCETILLPVPTEATGGARVESVTGPTARTMIATGVTYTAGGDLPTIWNINPDLRPLNRWTVDTDTLTAAYGSGLNAVAVTGVSATETVFVLRSTTAPAGRGADQLVQRLAGTLTVLNPLNCSAAQGQTWNDVVTARGDQLSVIGRCGNGEVKLPRVYIRRETRFANVTRNLPSGIVWNTAMLAQNATSYPKSGLQVSGEPVGGGATVTYRLAFGSWVEVTS